LVNRTNPGFLQYISEKTSISTSLAQILVNRGIRDIDAVKEFLNPSLDGIHDPFLLPDMNRAVERVRSAIQRNETVLVHGDYDADGITSAALLVSGLREMGLNVCYHIPNRIVEGYGLSRVGIGKAKDRGASLIITADCGISSLDEVLEARSQGIDIIVTDHHEPRDVLPDAVAVINPHRKDSEYPFRYLAGVGVAFKLMQALMDDGAVEKFLDILTIGTVADSVPLTGENRIFVTYGLRHINGSSCRTGIKALKDVAGVDGNLKSGLLAFTLIPRINAAGRLDDASEAVELFMTDDEARAKGIAMLLDGQNRKRQKIEGDVLKSALGMIDAERLDNAIVLSSPDWHPGVVGIVASRLADMFYRPVFLFSEKESIAKGSARGIPPLHLYRTIAECSGLLLGFGGHRQAAGLRLPINKLDEFSIQINRIVERELKEEDYIPVLEIDASVKLADINFALIKELGLLEPFGNANREPILGAKEVEIMNYRIVGNNHLKILLRQHGTSLDSIGFSMGKRADSITTGAPLDIAFIPSINEWNGTRSLQLNLRALRPGN
jgi:single-stranded-DNA-specific exonuclease